jgi:HK97 family phage prohead protease
MTLERRIANIPVEVRRTDSGVHIQGYAAMFDQPAHREVVRSSAFTKTLAERDDVRLLLNHDGVPLARTKSGTLTLRVDDIGLWVEADLDAANPDAQRLISALERGDIDQMSFAFEIIREARTSDGTRELIEVKLYDVSIVTYPWYDTTSVGLTRKEGATLCLRSLAPDELAEVLAELQPESAAEATESAVEDDSEDVDRSVDNEIEARNRLIEARALLGLIG